MSQRLLRRKVGMEESDYLNDQVTPPVLIRRVITKSFSTHNENRYIVDGQERPSHDLTAEQRGHIYETVFQDGRISVHCKFRISDKETSQLLTGLKSLKNGDEGLVRRYPGRREVHQAKALNFDWLLNHIDYKIFEARVEGMGGRVVTDSLKVDEVTKASAQLASYVELVLGSLRAIDTILSEENPGDHVQDLLQLHSGTDLHLKKISKGTSSVISLSNHLMAEAPEDSFDVGERARLQHAVITAHKMRQELPDLSERAETALRRITSVIEHGQDLNPASLTAEMNRLRKHFPVLKHIKVVGDNISIEILGAHITLTPDDRVVVEGDTRQLLDVGRIGGSIANPELPRDRIADRFVADEEEEA